MPTKSRLVRVFISSTFRDFIQERDELVKKVFPELRRRCKERFVELLEVDLRWGITEEQAKGGETLRVCLEEIDRCRPSAPVFFVGMLGERYGWVPPPSYFRKDVLEDPDLGWVKEHIDGKSVTELEVLHGVLRNEAMRDKAFFYFRKEGYQKSHWGDIKEYHAAIRPPVEVRREDFTNEGSERGKEVDDAKQRKLKQAVRDASLKWEPRYYEVPAQMASMVLEDLWNAIDQAFPAQSVPNDAERRRLEHEAFGQSRVAGYIPRPALFAKLDQWLTAPSSTVCVVTGESGSGKSALLASWLAQLGQNAPKHLFVHYIGGTPESSTARSIVFRLLHEIREWGAVADPVPDDYSEAVSVLPVWLRRAGEGKEGPVLLMLDALNQLENEDELGLGWLPKELPPRVRLLVSTLPGKAEDELRQRKWVTDPVDVPALEPTERRSIIEHFLRDAGKNPDAIPVDKLANAQQSANALYLRVVLNELKLRASFGKVEELLDDLLEAKDPSELFMRVLKNLEELDRERPDLVRESLGYLGLARRGLTEGELLELLSDDPAPSSSPLPRHYWSPLYLALADSLVSRNGQLGFFHDYLKKAVESEYLDEDRERKKIHGRLGELALAWDTDKFGSSLKDYALEYGAWHVRRTGDHEALWSLLSDEGYLTEQVERSGHARNSLSALTEGIEACASREEGGLKDDERLAWLASKRAQVQEEAQSGMVIKALEYFAQASIQDSGRVERALRILSVLRAREFHRACQMLLMMETLRWAAEKKVIPHVIFESIVEAAEEKVPKNTQVDFFPGFAEIIHAAFAELLVRFAALSASGSALVLNCAKIAFARQNYTIAAALRADFLPRCVEILITTGRSEEAFRLCNETIKVDGDRYLSDGARLLSYLEAICWLSTSLPNSQLQDLMDKCSRRIHEIQDADYKIRCLSLFGEILAKADPQRSKDTFLHAASLARQREDHEKRFSSAIAVCCALVKAGSEPEATALFDEELGLYADASSPGSETCNFLSGETEGLAELIVSCPSLSMVTRWMDFIVRASFDSALSKTNGYFIGVFSDLICDLARKLYSNDAWEHRQWVPAIIEYIASNRPIAADGELGSMAAYSLASMASIAALASDSKKSDKLHDLALQEGADTYQRTGENALAEAACEAARSGQIDRALQYWEIRQRLDPCNEVDEGESSAGVRLSPEFRQVAGDEPSQTNPSHADTFDGLAASFFHDLLRVGSALEASLVTAEWLKRHPTKTQSECINWLLFGALVKQDRFAEAADQLRLLAGWKSSNDYSSAHYGHPLRNQEEFNSLAVHIASAHQWDLLEEFWSKTEKPTFFLSSFLASYNLAPKLSSEVADFFRRAFDRHARRLHSTKPSEDNLSLRAVALFLVGKSEDAKSLVASLCSTEFSSKRGERVNDWKRQKALHRCLESLLGQSDSLVQNHSSMKESLSCADESTNLQCRVHLIGAVAEGGHIPLAWVLQKSISDQDVWLLAFDCIARVTSRADSVLMMAYAEQSVAEFNSREGWNPIRLCQSLIKSELGCVAEPILRELAGDGGSVHDCSQVAAALAGAGDSHTSHKLFVRTRSFLEEQAFPKKHCLSDAFTFITCAIQAGAQDEAFRVLDRALDVAFSQEHSLDRHSSLSSLVETLTSFPVSPSRRRLLAKVVRLGRKIWASRSEGQILPEIIKASASCGEFGVALRLANMLQTDPAYADLIPHYKAHIAASMAAVGELRLALGLLSSLKDPYQYTSVWLAAASQLISLNEFNECNALLGNLTAFLFEKSEARVLTGEFQPIFDFLAATANLQPFHKFMANLLAHPVTHGELWGALGIILSKESCDVGLRRSLTHRFASNALSDLVVADAQSTSGRKRNHQALMQIANFAVEHMEADFDWVMRFKTKLLQAGCMDLRLGSIDFNKKLPWIRAFFGVCTPNPAMTKMQIAALIDAYAAKGDIAGMSSIARGLPQTDIWDSLQSAAEGMGACTIDIAESLEAQDNHEEALKIRISALEISSILLGHGHKSVVKLADSVSHWPDPEEKLAYYRKALSSSESLYGSSDVHFCRLANKLGIMLFEGGSYGEALPLFVASHDGYLRAIGGDSDETLSALLNCALARRKLGQLARSIDDLRSVVDGRRRRLGDSDRRTLRVLDEIAEAYMEQSDWESAMEALSIALQAERPPEHAEDSTHWRKQIAYDETRARRLLRFGEAQCANKSFTDAKASVQESIGLYSSLMANARIKGDRKEKCFALGLRAQNLLAEVFAGVGDFGNAVRIQEAVVEALKDSKGDNDSRTCEAQLDLSTLVFRAGDYPACERVLRDLIDRATDKPSDTHAMAVKGLAHCLVKQQSPKEALSVVRLQSEKSDFLLEALRPTLVRLECLAGDPERARNLAADEFASNPQNSSKIKMCWLADKDFSVIHAFLEKFEA